MKDLLISCMQNYFPYQVRVWVNSILASGFLGDIVMINFGCPDETIQFLESKGVKVIDTQPSNLHIVVDRFINIFQFLSTCRYQYRYVIATDVKDIAFQSNPVDFLDKNCYSGRDIVVCSENIRYKDELWGDQNLKNSFPFMYDRLKDNEIYNAGVIAGKMDAVQDFCLQIYTLSLISTERQPDQVAMNILINSFPYKGKVNLVSQASGYVANLGTTLDPKITEAYACKWNGAAPVIKEDGIYTDYGKLISIVHQYDRVPGLQEFFQSKFR